MIVDMALEARTATPVLPLRKNTGVLSSHRVAATMRCRGICSLESLPRRAFT